MSVTKARPATFDRSQQHRRSMYAKLQIAKKELNMNEDDYRQIMFDNSGQMSATKCSDADLDKILDVLKSKGFKPKKSTSRADHPLARKARALWISLHHLNAIKNPSEKALEAFAKRQLGVSRLQWADQSQGYKLIEALKNVAARNGWDHGNIGSHQNGILLIHHRLCDAILNKLVATDSTPASWTLKEAAFRLCGEELPNCPSIGDYQTLAKALGQKLREIAP